MSAFSNSSELLEALRTHRLLDLARLAELTRDLATLPSASPDFARHLVQRGWLTPYQVNQLFQGRGHDLVLGQYVLMELLGEGGMGQVFKARHRSLDRIVALKRIRKELVTNPDAVRRFRREIEAAARLRHDNVILAYDADEMGGTHFFVMEYAEGADLGQLVKQEGPLAVARACDLVRQTAIGLQHAHEKGLVHRDVKPSNLLLTNRGVVKVLDLGLARLRRSEDETAASLTDTGVVMGSLDFLAPEQARDASRVDIRADLYSLGCVLFFLLTGRVPYPGGTTMEKLFKHQWEEPPAVEPLRPDVPPGLAAVVRKLMAKREDDRYPTPADAAAALLPWTRPTGSEAAALQTPSGSESIRLEPTWSGIGQGGERSGGAHHSAKQVVSARRWLAAVGVALTVVLGATTFGLIYFDRPITRKEDNNKPEPVKPVVVYSQREQEARDAVTLLHTRLTNPHEDRDRLWQDLVDFRARSWDLPQGLIAAGFMADTPSPLDRLLPSAIPTTEGKPPPGVVAVLGGHWGQHGNQVNCVAVSPNGEWVAGGGNHSEIRLWKAGAVPPRVLRVKDLRPWAVLAFTRDGKAFLAADKQGAVYRWELAGASGYRLLLLARPETPLSLAFAPMGTALAVGGAEGTVRVYDLDLGGPRKAPRVFVKAHTGPVRSLAFSGEGKGTPFLLASAGEDKVVRVWNLQASNGGAPEKPIAELKGHPTPVAVVAFCPHDSSLLASAGRDDAIRLWKWMPGKATVEVLPVPGEAIGALAFAPDGTALAAGGANQRVRIWDLPLTETSAPPTLLDGHTNSVTALTFGTSGKTLVSGGLDAAVRQWDLAQGRWRERHPIQGHTHHVSGLAFSPDGCTLGTSGEDARVYLWDLMAPLPKVRFHSDGLGSVVRSIAFAPDGKTLVFGVAGRLHRWGLTAAPAPAVWVSPRDSRSRILNVAVTPDGRMVAAGLESGEVELWRQTPEGFRYSQTWKAHDWNSAVTFTPDGKTLATVGSDRQIVLWELTSKPSKRTLAPQHPNLVSGLVFSPNGKWLATGCSDGNVRMWNWAEVRREHALPRYEVMVGGRVFLAFAPDGRTLVAANAQGKLIQIKVDTGEVVRSEHLTTGFAGIAFAPDSRHVAVGAVEGVVYLIRLSLLAKPAEEAK